MNTEKHLHIIALNIPYPADYGGVYDLFYKLPALQQQNVIITLHCFTKDRTEQPELNKYCKAVYYYQRNTGRKGFSLRLPYIVSSRINETLAERLLQDDHPILMEGIHCSYLANDPRFKTRKIFIRLHNVENEYYYRLYSFSHHLRNTIFYWIEWKQLYRYEKNIANLGNALWAVSKQDVEYYQRELNSTTIDYLPLFIPQWPMHMPESMGSYCLYHGNLEVEENEYAALWLLKHVFNKLDIPFVIAGKNPSKKLAAAIKKYKQVKLIANPAETEMQDIIEKAHIHVLPSFNTTGIKIKLLNALYNGRHCVVNDAMVAIPVLSDICHVVNSASEFKERIQLLYHQPFTKAEKTYRQHVLQAEFSNEANAKQIVQWIWKNET